MCLLLHVKRQTGRPGSVQRKTFRDIELWGSVIHSEGVSSGQRNSAAKEKFKEECVEVRALKV